MNDTTPDITQDTSAPDPEKAARIAQQPASRKRWLIAMLLFVTVVINYLDRSNLSIVAPELMRDSPSVRSRRAGFSPRSAGPMPPCRSPAAGWWTAYDRAFCMHWRSPCGRWQRWAWGLSAVLPDYSDCDSW
jgi:hypothetical protein